ncbi:mitochondrial inner membrane protease subunit 1 [Scaptodrosophila lebanonensis]|uniref:Mitochondrial inner membrane protease subunit n=1 Tax=Drosophila lebanonensis TaxID=7225 RepID=A0A6J2U445_DROLE|nr:mitochondrial inner membrane protease subunit 1 [Scaptodrosophila lebanonensis]
MKYNILTRLRSLMRITIQYACITHCTFEYLGDFVLCKGPSMEPTLFSDNVLLTERISKYWRNYQSGDIIIAVSPVNADQYICKRIVAVSGERIVTQKPHPIEAESVQKPVKTAMTTDYVPRGCVWIEGDNKGNSSDSRYYGPIPLGLIRSRVVCRVWPLSQLSGL